MCGTKPTVCHAAFPTFGSRSSDFFRCDHVGMWEQHGRQKGGTTLQLKQVLVLPVDRKLSSYANYFKIKPRQADTAPDH